MSFNQMDQLNKFMDDQAKLTPEQKAKLHDDMLANQDPNLAHSLISEKAKQQEGIAEALKDFK